MPNILSYRIRLTRNMVQILFFLSLVLTGVEVKAQESSSSAEIRNKRSTYTNPILNQVFPDTSIINAPNGWFYAYSTDSYYHGKMLNIQVAKSRDLIHWTYLGDALPEKSIHGLKNREYFIALPIMLN